MFGVQETKVLVRSLVDWKEEVDCQHSGSFTHTDKLLSYPWGRDPRGPEVVLCTVSYYLQRKYGSFVRCSVVTVIVFEKKYFSFVRMGKRNIYFSC